MAEPARPQVPALTEEDLKKAVLINEDLISPPRFADG